MRTPGLAAIIMALVLAACSDASAPVAMGPDSMGPDAVSDLGSAHFRLSDKQNQCDDNDRNHHRWGRHHRYIRFRHWGWRGHSRSRLHFRGYDNNQQDCDGDGDGAPKTGSIAGAVANEGAPAAGYSVFLLSADGATVVHTALTDGTGAYVFAEVEAGTYLVCEDNPFTEAHTFLGETRPQTGAACPRALYGPVGFSVTLAAGAAVTGNSFSNMRLD